MTAGSDLLVGRERELERLDGALAGLAAGTGGLWLISGEAGIGKSRLVEWLAARAAEHDIRVAWGLSWEAGGAPSYWPWIQVLRELVAVAGGAAEVTARLGPSAGALARLLPEVADLVADADGPPRLDPEHASFHLMDAVARVVQTAAQRRPVVVILEDLHAADPSSLQVLDFVARQLRTSPALVVGTHREAGADLSDRAPLIWRASRGAQSLRLARLDDGAIGRYVAAACGVEPPPCLVRRLLEATDGNPLHLAETVSLLRARGGPGVCADGGALGVPDSLRSAVSERLNRLSSGPRETLQVASILGRDFSVGPLAELAGSPPDEVGDALEVARDAGLVEAAPDGGWRFVHMLTREAVRSGLEPSRRRGLHRRRARQLAALADPPWSEIALHLDAAGAEHRAAAVDAWRRAARRAADRHAFEDAADHWERAFAAMDEAADAGPEARLELLLDVADAQVTAGRADAGRASCRRAAELARTVGSARQLARAALIRGRVFVYGTVDASLVQLFEEALDRLEPDELRLRALVTARLAAARQPSAPPEGPFELARQAVDLARRVDDPRVLLDTITSASSALMDLAEPSERLALNREHVRLAEALRDPVSAFRGHLRVMVDALELGRITEIDRALAAAEALAGRTGLPHHRWVVEAGYALRDTMSGRFGEAEHRLAAAAEAAAHAGDPNSERCLALQRIALDRARERHAELAESCRRLLRAAGTTAGTAIWLVPALGGVLARTEPDASELPVIDADTEAEILALGDRAALCGLSEMAVCAADRERAARLEARLRPFSELHSHHGLTGLAWDGPVSRCLALLAELGERPEETDRWFEHAARAAAAVGSPPMAARLAYEHGRALVRRGADDAARECLDRARALAEELGLEGLLELIDRVEGPAPAQRAATSTPSDHRPTLSLERDGELWLCRSSGAAFRLKDTKGVRFLALLLERPGVEVHVLDLVAAADGGPAVDTGDAGEVLDDRARAEYRRRVEELQAELAEAEGWNDAGRAERAREELELLSAELARAFGLGGRTRRSGAAAERARVNVQRRLRDAVERIAAQDEAAGRHLEAALRTGTFCCYEPPP